ncbi:MAG TPA: NAD(P)-dependent oxidoreductase [Phycisphaerae bacterium]|nr:NAD(P)-dependent oxidoreductase [Phycisphaerae bacterium]
MFKILLAEPLDAQAEARLEAGATVVRPPAPDEQTLCHLVADCHALIARTETRVTRAVLEAGKRLRVVGVAGVGTERVDTAAAEALGITVLNTAEASADAVAEFTVALMLQLLRPVPRLAQEYRHGRFKPARARPHGNELGGLTVGIVGMGRIGSRVGRICSAGFGARVLYNDIVDVGPFPFETAAVDKPTIWSRGDIVTLHVPLTALTRGLVDADVLARFRPSAMLINTARGPVVDTDALTAALQQGRIAGAALDVTDPEPLPAEHPLFACERCILTPHVAARTTAGLGGMFAIVDHVLAFLRGREEPTQ